MMLPLTGDTIQEFTVEELRAKVGTGMQIDNPEENMLLSMGPQHPSTHGVLRLLLELDGETVVNLAPDIGFLHTGIEKNMEAKTYTKALVMTDRMDYLSPMSNNLATSWRWKSCSAWRRRPAPRRSASFWPNCSGSPATWSGWAPSALDLAAMSVFLYCFREREYILDLFEMVAGQRMMVSYFRPGGVWRDVPEEFEPAVRQLPRLLPGQNRRLRSPAQERTRSSSNAPKGWAWSRPRRHRLGADRRQPAWFWRELGCAQNNPLLRLRAI
jgi:NADH-quinone oxidoreductase subunit D